MEHGQVAFDAVCGDAQAAEREVALAERIDGLKGEMGRLTAALRVAKAREAEAARRVALEGQAERRKRVAKLLDRRAGHAADFEAGIKQAVQAYRKLHEVNTRVLAAAAFEAKPNGTLLHSGELTRIAAHELFRQGGVPVSTGGSHPELFMPSFPGGQPPDLRFRDQPDRITALTAVIAEANQRAVDLMEQTIATAPLPPVSAEGEGE